MHTLAGHRRPIRAVAYAPGEAPLLVSAGDDREVRLWDPVGRQPAGVLDARRAVNALAFNASGTRLAGGGPAASLSVWDVAKRSREIGCSAGLRPAVAVGWSGDGRAVLAGLRGQVYGGEPGSLVCWDLGFLPSDTRWVGEVESAAFAPSRDLFAVGRLDRAVELWEVGRPQRDPFCWLPARVRALCFSPGEANSLAVATGRVIQVWDVQERRWLALCKGHRADVFALAFSPDGRRLLSGGMDRSVRLWDVVSGRELAAWDWQVGAVHAVAFAPDGMTAAAGGEKPALVVWDVDEG
jgi:WD40 repeat protein